MFDDDALLPISALQHLLFCERQCALIHVERLWIENRLTVEGRHMHEKAHEAPGETRGTMRIARGVQLRSLRLGLVGVADVVEFERDKSGHSVPFPIEYKRGRPKAHDADRVQLCAQALCLEEMLDVKVPRGALFYGQTRRRRDVLVDATLRQRTEQACARLHDMIGNRETPRARREKKCDSCSLLNLCLPDAVAPSRSAARHFAKALAMSLSQTFEGGGAT